MAVQSSLSDRQQIVLYVLMITSATLSIIGSSTIVYRVAMNPQHTTSYDRIMLGLGCADIVSSLSFLLTPMLIPAETSSRVWAVGTDLTCSMLGWLRQLGLSCLGYNAFLSIYFVMTLKYNISAEDFAASYEAYIHFLTIFYFLMTATAGFVFNFYSERPLGVGCWVTKEYCFSEEHCIGKTLTWIYGAFAILMCWIILIVCQLMIYFHIRGIFKREGIPTSQSVHVKRVAMQGFLYVMSFFMVYAPSAIIRWLELYHGYDASRESEVYGEMILYAVFMPLQGFFNMFIYSRPRYIKLKDSGVPFFKATWKAAFEPDIPRFIEQYQQSNYQYGEGPSSSTKASSKYLKNIRESQALQSILEVAEIERIGSEEQIRTDLTIQSD